MQRRPNYQPHTDAAPDLHVAPNPERVDQVYAAVAEHLTSHAMTAADPENNLVADILNMTAADATTLLSLVDDDDIQGHLPKVAVHLARHLATAGHDPTPQAVMARARGPYDIDPRPTYRALVLYIAAIYTMGMPLDPWGDARTVVEDAYRRSKGETGLRTAQMADAHADIDELDNLTDIAEQRLNIHRQRIQALRQRCRPASER